MQAKQDPSLTFHLIAHFPFSLNPQGLLGLYFPLGRRYYMVPRIEAVHVVRVGEVSRTEWHSPQPIDLGLVGWVCWGRADVSWVGRLGRQRRCEIDRRLADRLGRLYGFAFFRHC